MEARSFDHADDRHLEPVVDPEYVDAAAGLLRADLRPVIAEELIKACPRIGIETRPCSGRNYPAEIACCPKRVQDETIFPECLGVRRECDVMGQQFVGIGPSQHLTTVDPFWHHKIAALESHDCRKLVASIVIESIIHIREPRPQVCYL